MLKLRKKTRNTYYVAGYATNNLDFAILVANENAKKLKKPTSVYYGVTSRIAYTAWG